LKRAEFGLDIKCQENEDFRRSLNSKADKSRMFSLWADYRSVQLKAARPMLLVEQC